MDEPTKPDLDSPPTPRRQDVRDEKPRSRPGRARSHPATALCLQRQIRRGRAPSQARPSESAAREAFDLLQALNTGHAGTLSTIHANSAEALARLASCAAERRRSAVPANSSADCRGDPDRAASESDRPTAYVQRGRSADVPARTRHRAVYGEGDRRDGPGYGTGGDYVAGQTPRHAWLVPQQLTHHDGG